METKQLAPIKIQPQQPFIIQLNKPNNNIRTQSTIKRPVEALLAAPLQAKRKAKAQAKDRLKATQAAAESAKAVPENPDADNPAEEEGAPTAKPLVKMRGLTR